MGVKKEAIGLSPGVANNCPECGSFVVFSDCGEYVCNSCGLVLDEMEFNEDLLSENNVGTVHENHLAFTGGVLGTIVNTRNIVGKQIYLESNRTEKQALEELVSLQAELDIPRGIFSETVKYLRMFLKAGGDMPNEGTDAFMRGLVYLVYRINCRIPPDGLRRTEAEMVKNLMLRQGVYIPEITIQPSVYEYIFNICAKVNRIDLVRAAQKWYSSLTVANFTPKAVACACIYKASLVKSRKAKKKDAKDLKPVSFATLAEAASIQQATVRNTFNHLFAPDKVITEIVRKLKKKRNIEIQGLEEKATELLAKVPKTRRFIARDLACACVYKAAVKLGLKLSVEVVADTVKATPIRVRSIAEGVLSSSTRQLSKGFEINGFLRAAVYALRLAAKKVENSYTYHQRSPEQNCF